MYLTNKEIREFEDKEDYKSILKMNIQIGKFLDFSPEIEWMVGTEESSCFNPKMLGYDTPESQKAYAEKYLQEQKNRFPDRWGIQNRDQVIKKEYYPDFHLDWNHLMEAIKRLNQKDINIIINPEDIFFTWKFVSYKCQ